MGGSKMEQIKKFILEQTAKNNVTVPEAKKLLLEIQQNSEQGENDIAVIGISCKFTDCEDQYEYWDKLFNGESCFVPYTEERSNYYRTVFDNPHYAEFLGTTILSGDENEEKARHKAGFLSDIDKFDAAFFNIPPREAKFMDPSQRLFLQTAWSAIEDAGYGGKKIVGTNTGVFVGRDGTSSTFYKFITESDPMHLTGTWEGILASRINYIFNLRGPSMVIDTACSSGLVSIHAACQSLRNKECDYAIAGGISLGTSAVAEDEDGKGDALTSVASNDNLVRTFDRKSTGTVFGEGVTAVLLKPLNKAIADKDSIYAVIKGSAINNDGASNGITAPNPAAQEDVIVKAWEQARINPETISYIEAHGTGTLLGDPIEIKGLTGAFRKYTNKKQFCGIGSVKTNMGHLVGASGIAGALKVILSLKEKKLPASLNFDEPNPHINFCESPLYVIDKLRDWKSNEAPRRAGISSFGFSGTNCHIVLEEAPQMVQETESNDNRDYILTLSGKSKSSLQELIKKYYKFVERRKQNNLGNICYTANTGRGHYDYRLVLKLKDFEDFKQKITLLQEKGLEQEQDHGIYYGFNKVVSDRKKIKEEGEITEGEKRELSKLANSIINEMLEVDDENHNKLMDELGELYIKGANIDWDLLYKDQNRVKVNLPVYPFEKKVYWGDVKVSKLKDMNNMKKEFSHPMIDRCIVKSMNIDIYESELSIDRHWTLSDHVFFENSLLPGTAYLEIGREFGSMYYPEKNIELRNITFLTPISVEKDEEKTVQYIIKKEKEYIELNIVSQVNQLQTEVDDEWVTHVSMKISPNLDTNTGLRDLERIRNGEDMIEIEVNKEELSKEKNIYFGPRWLNLNYVSRSEKNVFAELNIPSELKDDLKEYPLHPGMMDNAVNAATQSFGRGGLYLPLSYKSIKLFGPMPEHFFSHIRKKESKDNNLETLSFDVSLIDGEGKPFAEVTDYTMKKVQIHTFDQATKLHNYYQVDWTLNEKLKVNNRPVKGTVVLLKDQKDFAQKLIPLLKNESTKIIEVELGSNYQKVAENYYVVDGTEESYTRLFKDIKEINHIIHTQSIFEFSDLLGLNRMKKYQTMALDSLFYISKALSKAKVNNEIRISLISDYVNEVTKTEESIIPSHAALFGLAKVVAQEFPNLEIQCIDMDGNTEISQIASEITSSERSFCVAYRNNKRYIEELQKVDWDKAIRQDIKIKDTGSYIITGGTGGIGLAIAEYLALNNAKNICLVNRSKFPDRNQWDDILRQEEKSNERLFSKIEKIRKIEELGANVICYSGDICDYEQTNNILKSIRDNYGKINGVFHCAGVAGDGFIFRKEKVVFDEVTHPKIEGTWLIDHLTMEDNIDLFVLFSSIATLFGGRGQGDYVAANSYLDAFSSYRNLRGQKTITINWPAWNEVGMAVDHKVSEEVVLFKSIGNNRAYQVLDEILDINLSNFIPAELNLELLNSIREQLPIHLSKQIETSLNKISHLHVENKDLERNFKGEVNLQGKGEYTKTERTLAYIYASGLDLNEIDIYESFHAMGGDSIIAMELFKEIDKEFVGLVDISDMFSYPSIVEMADYIDSKINKKS